MSSFSCGSRVCVGRLTPLFSLRKQRHLPFPLSPYLLHARHHCTQAPPKKFTLLDCFFNSLCLITVLSEQSCKRCVRVIKECADIVSAYSMTTPTTRLRSQRLRRHAYFCENLYENLFTSKSFPHYRGEATLQLPCPIVQWIPLSLPRTTVHTNELVTTILK